MDFEDMNFQPIDLQGDQAEYQEVEKLNNLMELDPDTFEGQIFDTKTDFNKFNMDDMETDFEQFDLQHLGQNNTEVPIHDEL